MTAASHPGAGDHAATTPSSSLLAIRDLSIRFGGVVALDRVSFDVGEHDICGLIGPNGAGKTTLFNCLSCLYRCDSGEIRFAGRPIDGLPRHRMAGLGLGRTFQNLALFGNLTVRDNVLVGTHSQRRAGLLAHALGLPRSAREDAEAGRRADELIDLLGLAGLAGQRVSDLPFGSQKRVELARAMATRPRLLMLDEPACGLNHQEIDELAALVRMLRERFRLTVLLVEHHMRFVMGLCDRVVALDFGRKIAEGTPAEVRVHPDVIRAYLGAST